MRIGFSGEDIGEIIDSDGGLRPGFLAPEMGECPVTANAYNPRANGVRASDVAWQAAHDLDPCVRGDIVGITPRYGAQPAGGPVGGPDRRARRDAEIRAVLDRRQARFRSLREVLQDPARAAFVIVLAAERLPVLETIELHEQLGRSHMSVGALVVNKRSPTDAGELLAARRQVEDGYLAQLASALPGVPTTEVPLLPGEVLGEQGLERLAAHLL